MAGDQAAFMALETRFQQLENIVTQVLNQTNTLEGTISTSISAQGTRIESGLEAVQAIKQWTETQVGRIDDEIKTMKNKLDTVISEDRSRLDSLEKKSADQQKGEGYYGSYLKPILESKAVE